MLAAPPERAIAQRRRPPISSSREDGPQFLICPPWPAQGLLGPFGAQRLKIATRTTLEAHHTIVERALRARRVLPVALDMLLSAPLPAAVLILVPAYEPRFYS